MPARLKITTDASQATMYYMNYSDSVARKLRSTMSEKRNECFNKWLNPKGMLKKLFNDQKFARDSIDDARTMMLYLMEVVGNMQSHHQFENVDLYDIFSADDIYSVWRYNNAYWYTNSGETPLTQCRVDYMEANLLRNFIEDADRATTTDNPAPGASLRFGHESVVLPLCCLMGLKMSLPTTTGTTCATISSINFHASPSSISRNETLHIIPYCGAHLHDAERHHAAQASDRQL